MFKYYLLLTFRNLQRRKGFSLINIFGLALGIACCSLILLWILDELNFDRFHPKADRIYRVVHQRQSKDIHQTSAITPPALGPALRAEFPEVKDFTRFSMFYGSVLLRHEDRAFYESGGGYADPSFFTMFHFPLTRGRPESVLTATDSIVISETLAEKYFKYTDPVGQTLRLENKHDLIVTGVMRDIPSNSHLEFDFLVPLAIQEKWQIAQLNSWDPQMMYTYILLTDTDIARSLSARFNPFSARIQPTSEGSLLLQPLPDIHFYSDFALDVYARLGDVSLIYILGVIAVFILLIACFNFVNLTTACASERTKEIGVRRVVGSRRWDLIRQFCTETFLVASVSLFCSIILVELILPDFNHLTGKQLTLGYTDPQFLLGLFAIGLLAGLVSSIYPSIYLSSLRPVSVLRGYLSQNLGQKTVRLLLVVSQFTITVSLLICTLFLVRQLEYIQSKDLGMDSDNLLYIQGRPGLSARFDALKQSLLTNPAVSSVTSASNVTSGIPMTSLNVNWEGKNIDEKQVLYGLFTDYDYLKTFNLELVEGRDFSPGITSDATQAFIINESAARLMGLDSAVDHELAMGDRTGIIIGVVENYHYLSLHQEILPLILQIRPEDCPFVFIRVKPDQLAGTLDFIQTTWDKYMPGFPCEYHFYNQALDQAYRTEKQISRVLSSFSILAMVISGLGLLGLATYSTNRRTKEIGIRKVLGASNLHILYQLIRQFTVWVVMAAGLACPLAYLITGQLLESWAYRVPITLAPFICAIAIALFTAWAAIGYHAIKASLINPAKTLRYE